jgi:hypothetical protein
LYGYNDGHRLLVASRKLPEDAASLLLIHSDLVAGANGDDDAYWTGIPVPTARCYALMRTWTAPEMSRPGCVWTHALLITFSDVARFPDLGVLAGLARRPTQSSGFAEYGTPLNIDPGLEEKIRPPVSMVDALPILRSIYSPGFRGVLPARGRAREEAIFAIWSQQWPRLRRSFSFQTSGLSSISGTRFNLRLAVDGRDGAASYENDVHLQNWERTVVDDLTHPGEFRRFIWRYGSDIKRGPERFRFLAKVFNDTRHVILEGSTLSAILDDVADTLPDSNDGRVLKTDLVSGGTSDYSLLPPSDLLDILSYFVKTTSSDSLPFPPYSVFEAVLGRWPERSEEILSVAQLALELDSRIANEIISPLAQTVEPLTFVGMSRNYPAVQFRLAKSNTQLLDCPGLEKVPLPQLGALLDLLPDDPDLAGRVLDRLLSLDDELLATKFASKFPAIVAERIFDAIADQLADGRPSVPRRWMTAIGGVLKSMLPGKMLERAKLMSRLAACAFFLELDVTAGLAAPPSAWAAALKRSEDDVNGQTKQRLFAYLLAIALARPSSESEFLFERTFEAVHADIAVSRLPYDAFTSLAAYLPDLSWWQHWDTCLRLRTAVVNAYVENNLDPKSFRRLTKDQGLFDRLIDLAKGTSRGRRFLERLSNR